MQATKYFRNLRKGFFPSVEYRGKAETSWQKVTYLLLALVLSSLLLACGGCASSPEEAKIALPAKEELERYIQTADHLSEAQKRQMARRRPFVGMTIDEANLAMHKESTDLVVPGAAFRAVYVGDAGVRYYLYFHGKPARVVDWSYFSGEEIKLMDPEKLRPSPPISTP